MESSSALGVRPPAATRGYNRHRSPRRRDADRRRKAAMKKNRWLVASFKPQEKK